MTYGAFALVYDRLMKDVDYDAWYRHYRALLSRAGQIASAADVCCGTGHFALRLARDGVRVVGADLSEEMLAVAQQRARELGVQVPFVRMDAALLELPRPVDAILCACDGVNYLCTPEAVRSFFARAHEALRPGGALAFDISTAHKFQYALDGRAFGEDQGDLCYLWTNEYDRATRLCEMELTIFSQNRGMYARSFEEHTLRAHSIGELTSWLKAAGFTGVEFFSEMTMEPHRRGDHRVHAVAMRTP